MAGDAVLEDQELIVVHARVHRFDNLRGEVVQTLHGEERLAKLRLCHGGLVELLVVEDVERRPNVRHLALEDLAGGGVRVELEGAGDVHEDFLDGLAEPHHALLEHLPGVLVRL